MQALSPRWAMRQAFTTSPISLRSSRLLPATPPKIFSGANRKTIFYNSARRQVSIFVIQKIIVMQRYKPYDAPHKGLRNALAQMSLLAGRTDYSSPTEITRLHQ